MSDASAHAPTLAVSIVTFRPDLRRLEATLASLGRAIAFARSAHALGATRVWLIDNTPDAAAIGEIRSRAERGLGKSEVALEIRHGHGNIGFGRGHNIALSEDGSDFRLVLNPDVELQENAVLAALAFLREHPRVSLLAPAAFDDEGNRLYLCKRFPALFDLFLRGFAPGLGQRRWAARLDRYEMRDVVGNDVVEGVPIASGAFMFVRGEAVVRSGGFDPRFFLYFEDFDWSLRIGANAYVPSVRIVHHGGHAARKGYAHIGHFAAGAVRFYRKHGWKLT